MVNGENVSAMYAISDCFIFRKKIGAAFCKMLKKTSNLHGRLINNIHKTQFLRWHAYRYRMEQHAEVCRGGEVALNSMNAVEIFVPVFDNNGRRFSKTLHKQVKA